MYGGVVPLPELLLCPSQWSRQLYSHSFLGTEMGPCVFLKGWEEKPLHPYHDSPHGINTLWANFKALLYFTASDPQPPDPTTLDQ